MRTGIEHIDDPKLSDDHNGHIPTWPLTTREKERSWLVVEGKRTDNAELCTLVLVHEVGGTWAWYPHGFGKFGVRLPRTEAVRMAQKIVDDAG